jgi:hypothetical protein
VPRKPLELSDRDDPVSPTVPALQLELHHPAPRSLLCMDASFCVLRCRVSRRIVIAAGACGECRHTHWCISVGNPLAHPVSQKVPLEGEGKGSRVAKGSWGASDGVESTPQHALEQGRRRNKPHGQAVAGSIGGVAPVQGIGFS